MGEGFDSKEREPGNVPVSIFLVRHFEPTPGYPEDEPLVLEKATEQARKTAEWIVGCLKEGETIVIYGAGTKGRHQQSLELLTASIAQEIGNRTKQIRLIELPPSSKKRLSLRPADLWRFTDRAAGREMDYWLETEGESISTEPPARVAARLGSLLNGLIKFTKSQTELGTECQKVNWVLITSGEVVAAWTRSLPEIAKPVGLEPGGWLKLDVPGGEFTGLVNVTYKETTREGVIISPKS